MDVTKNLAGSRIRERLFVMWEEANGDPDAAYQLWHKVRPLLIDRGASVSPQHSAGSASLSSGHSSKKR